VRRRTVYTIACLTLACACVSAGNVAAASAPGSARAVDGAPVQVLGTSQERFTAQALAENARGAAVVVWTEDPTGAAPSRVYAALAAPGRPFGPAIRLAGVSGEFDQVAAAISPAGQVVVAVLRAYSPPETPYAATGTVSRGMSALTRVGLAGDRAESGLSVAAGSRIAAVGWTDAQGPQVIQRRWKGGWAQPTDPAAVGDATLASIAIDDQNRLHTVWGEISAGVQQLFETTGHDIAAPVLAAPISSSDGLGPIAETPDGGVAGVFRADLTGADEPSGADVNAFAWSPSRAPATAVTFGTGVFGCAAVATAPDGRALVAYQTASGEYVAAGSPSLRFDRGARIHRGNDACPIAAAIANGGTGALLWGGLSVSEVPPRLALIDASGRQYRSLQLSRGPLDLGLVSVDGAGAPTVVWSQQNTFGFYALRLPSPARATASGRERPAAYTVDPDRRM
jgi:hypothetical protein